MTQTEIILSVIVGIPVVFWIGRLSTKVAWFHAKSEQKYTVPEFVRGRQ